MSKENKGQSLKTLDVRYDLFVFNDNEGGHIEPFQLDGENNTSFTLRNGRVSIRSGDVSADLALSDTAYGDDAEGDSLGFDFTDSAGAKHYLSLIFPESFTAGEYCHGLIGQYDDKGEKGPPQEIAGVEERSYTVFQNSQAKKGVKPADVTTDFPQWDPFPKNFEEEKWPDFGFQMGYYALQMTRRNLDPKKTDISEDVDEEIVKLYRMSGDHAIRSILVTDPNTIGVDMYQGNPTLTMDDNNDGDSIRSLWGDDAEAGDSEFPIYFNVLLDGMTNTLKGVMRTTAGTGKEFYLWKGKVPPQPAEAV